MSITKKNRRVARNPSQQDPRVGPEGTIASVQAERDLLISVLETLSQSQHIKAYLERLVRQVRKYSGCRCVGIRLLDDNGNIPYVSYTGFSREFYESEHPLCIKSDKCMCVNVITGNTQSGLPSYTKGGSFLSNGTTKLLASAHQETKGQTRNVCNRYGYESVALVPMKHKGKILGLIHLADESETKIPLERVQFLERVGVYIGETLHIFMSEEALKVSENHYRALYEDAPNAYFSVGVDGYIKQANRSAAELLGYSLDELIGWRLFNLYADTPNGKAKAEGLFNRFRAGEEIRDEELEMCRADGSKVWISLSVRPIYDKKGQVVESRSVVVDITERKRAEEALRESETKFRSLAEQSPNMIFINKRGRIIYANNKCETMMGYKKEEFYSPNFNFLTLIAPEYIDLVEASFTSYMKGEEISVYEYALLTKDGKRIEAILTTQLIEHGGETAILGTVTDITERKETEKKLEESENKLNSILSSMVDLIFVFDKEARFTFYRASATELYVPPERFLGKKYSEVLPPHTYKLTTAAFNKNRRGEVAEYEYWLELGGQTKWYSAKLSPIFSDGEFVGSVAVVRDITERKQLEETRIERATATAKAEEVRQSRRRIIAMQESLRKDIAQQLHGTVQNGLIILMHRLTELERSPLPEQIGAEIADMRQKLGKLLDDHVRPISQRLFPAILHRGLVPALQSLVDHFEIAQSIDMELSEELKSQEKINPKFITEQTRLAAYRIAEEALVNVIKHAKASKITVKLEPSSKGWLQLMVRDNGQGFDMTSNSVGQGILMMQDYAEVLGGDCVISSTPRKGTEVRAALPLATPGAECPERA